MPTAPITGGTSGIGKASALLLHNQGYGVAITGQNPDNLTVAQRELPDDVLVVRADSRSLSDTDALIETVRDRFGSLDVLFLNAGMVGSKRVEEFTEREFDDIVAVNFKGQFFTLQKALPVINDGGSIIFNIGIGARRNIPGGTVLGATKGALLSMMPSLAIELARRGIRVNSVSPGVVETPMWDKIGIPPQMRSGLADKVPLGRVGTPQDIADTVAFLASDASRFITGQDIVVAGGGGLNA